LQEGQAFGQHRDLVFGGGQVSCHRLTTSRRHPTQLAALVRRRGHRQRVGRDAEQSQDEVVDAPGPQGSDVPPLPQHSAEALGHAADTAEQLGLATEVVEPGAFQP
jgi:hypothetical protein